MFKLLVTVSTYKINKQECMANRDMFHKLPWALKTYFCPWETKKSVSLDLHKDPRFFFSFSATFKIFRVRVVEKMSRVRRVKKSVVQQCRVLARPKYTETCGLERTLFLKAIRDVLN